LIVLGDFVPGPVVQGCAFIPKNAAFDHKIIPVSLSDEIQRVHVSSLEIHFVDIFTPGTEDNSSHLRPDGCHRAHAARLESCVKSGPAEFAVLEGGAGGADGFDFGVRNRVMMLGNLIAARRQDFPMPDDDATDGRKRGIRTVFDGDPERFTHEFFVVDLHRCVFDINSRAQLNPLRGTPIPILTQCAEADLVPRTPTFSPGELQQLSLVTQVQSNLFGVAYVLDEPSAGLYPADNEALLRAGATLK
jgi:hypothetical protein